MLESAHRVLTEQAK